MDAMTCRELVGFPIDYLENVLPTGQRAAFERHLRVCPACRNYLNSYRQSIRIAHRALRTTNDPVPVDVPEDLIRAILWSRVADD
jgi:predicted anti-sigma-YlaC factor YlaD